MSGKPCPKEPVYRNRRLLDLAAQAPKCFHCEKPNDGTVVGAHANWSWAGKGMGTKAHDLVAMVCQECHREMDGYEREPLNVEYDWLKAQYKTTVWLLQEGWLKVVTK